MTEKILTGNGIRDWDPKIGDDYARKVGLL